MYVCKEAHEAGALRYDRFEKVPSNGVRNRKSSSEAIDARVEACTGSQFAIFTKWRVEVDGRSLCEVVSELSPAEFHSMAAINKRLLGNPNAQGIPTKARGKIASRM